MPKNIKTWAKSENFNPLVFLFNKDRISMYANTLNMIAHHPFVGVGVNTYSKNYAKYKTEKAEKYAHTLDTSYAQSNYFQMAGETGLIGLGVFFWLLCLLSRELINYYRKSRNDYLKVISMSLAACIMAFLINGLTESSLYYSRVAVMFWYFVGFSLSLKKLVNEEKH
jgi:O-antigen ligase